MSDMTETRQNTDDAVSPVIGVILMVAITVILAAVIAAFVFGMSGNIQSTKNVAATATQQGEDIIITYQGGSDNSNLNYLKMSVDGDRSATWYTIGTTGSTDSVADTTSTGLSVPVGKSWKFTGYGSSAKDHVIVTARFADGAEQVILDTFV